MDIMTRIHRGIHVVDANGKNMGKIDDFQAGEPESVMSVGLLDSTRHHPVGHPFVESAAVLTEADLSDEEAERLAHSGWVRIHKGPHLHPHFLPADEIDRVEDDKVWLKPGVKLK